MHGSENKFFFAEPENKFFFEPLQDEALLRKVIREKESELELEIEPSEVIEVIEKCCKFDNQINLISEAYHLAYGGPKDWLDNKVHLTEIETLMKNSVLHIAASNGNDDIVTLLIQRAPRLLFTFNENHDTVLHVAARNGRISTIKKLLDGYTDFERHDINIAWFNYKLSRVLDDFYDDNSNIERLLNFVQLKNDQGNTMFHEAMLCDKRNIGGDMIFIVCELFKTENWSRKSLSSSCYEYAIDIVNHAKKTVLYLAVENGNKDAVGLILNNCSKDMIRGLSPFVAAIMMRNQEILRIILKHQFNWIHSKDKHGRLPLHYAAFIGYLEGVDLLIESCKCCTIQRDNYGYFPIHLASHGGHLGVVKKLLEYCPDPTEMLDTLGRNILHMASNSGKHEVVRYILQSDQICKLDKNNKMINQKDKEGNTPLHLAAKSFHPKIVFYLTWDKRVDYDLVNKNNQTALDAHIEISQLCRLSTKQQLTRTALSSAGVKTSFRRADYDKVTKNDSNSPKLKKPSENGTKGDKSGSTANENDAKENSRIGSNTPQYFFFGGSQTKYKDRVQTLILVSTLIITASVAACFAVPGEADGKANNLYHAMFQCFIFFITISLFSSISATIILFWATLGLSQLVTSSLKIVMPLLGIALISLTLAFMAGLYTVISPLNWLANLFLVVAVIFVVLVILLYIVLFLPSASSKKSMRYISYYPFLFLTWLAE